MLIGLCGSICAGKHEIAHHLIRNHAFTALKIVPPALPNHSPAIRSTSTLPTLPEHVFPTANALLDFVTKRWREPFVTTDIWDDHILDVLRVRPFFMLVSVSAPLMTRWHRYNARNAAQGHPPSPLDQFAAASDTHLYSPHGLSSITAHATLSLLNPTASLPTLHTALHALDLTNPERLRPSWDAYFMHLASLAARRSNCMKRRVGCVLVRGHRVISTGYNGTPRHLKNCSEGGCGRCNSAAEGGVGLDACLCIHAEENALLEAGRERIGDGAVLYCDTCPCLTCSIKIVQVGVVEVVYSKGYSMDKQTAAVLEEGGVVLRQYSPPRDGMVYLDEAV